MCQNFCIALSVLGLLEVFGYSLSLSLSLSLFLSLSLSLSVTIGISPPFDAYIKPFKHWSYALFASVFWSFLYLLLLVDLQDCETWVEPGVRKKHFKILVDLILIKICTTLPNKIFYKVEKKNWNYNSFWSHFQKYIQKVTRKWLMTFSR